DATVPYRACGTDPTAGLASRAEPNHELASPPRFAGSARSQLLTEEKTRRQRASGAMVSSNEVTDRQSNIRRSMHMNADNMKQMRMVLHVGFRHYVLAVALAFLPQTLGAQGGGQFQQPPIIEATELLPASVLSGPGFHVERLVPTNGAMGRYTIVADE